MLSVRRYASATDLWIFLAGSSYRYPNFTYFIRGQVKLRLYDSVRRVRWN